MDSYYTKNLPYASSNKIDIFSGSMNLTQFLENLFISKPNIQLWNFTGMKNLDRLWAWDIVQKFLMNIQLYKWSIEFNARNYRLTLLLKMCRFYIGNLRFDVYLPHQKWIINVDHLQYKGTSIEKQLIERFSMEIIGEDLDDFTRKRASEILDFNEMDCKRLKISV